MPLNDLAESEALPSGPATCTVTPLELLLAIDLSLSTAEVAPFHPLDPRLTGTTVCAAFPLAEKNGPATWFLTAPWTPLKPATSSMALCLSAAVSPAGRL